MKTGPHWRLEGQRLLLGLMIIYSILATKLACSQTLDSLNPVIDGYVSTIALQADGKILVGGWFTAVGGQAHTNLARLNGDGDLDRGFSVAADGAVNSAAVQADGKILIGGSFSLVAGQPRTGIGRLSFDGTLDAGFNPGSDPGDSSAKNIQSLTLQPDGRILVGYYILSRTLQGLKCIGRLNPDGSWDTGFSPVAGGNGADSPYVSTIAVQADGKILLGGHFTTLNGQPRANIGRFNSDGTLDTNFNPGAMGSANYPDSYVKCLSIQQDGKVLVAGDFSTLGGQPRRSIGRLNADGSLDGAFNPGSNTAGSAYAVSSGLVQADGKIVVGGSFTFMAGQARYFFARLNSDGTLDSGFSGFDQGWAAQVYSLVEQADGKIIVGGSFRLGGSDRDGIGRINNNELPTQTLTCNGTMLTWLRGGSCPELCRTTFDLFTNGSGWVPLGLGSRTIGGWQLTNAAVPIDGTVRAQGFVSDGRSGSVVESYCGNPALSVQPASRTNEAGTTATFSSWAGASEPLAYEWLRDGMPLKDGGSIIGATTPTLVLSNVLKIDEGGYSLVASNNAGAVTSLVARLTVIDPVITIQPSGQFSDQYRNQYRQAGDSVNFQVCAAGTTPLGYQWWKDGVALTTATNLLLTISNLQPCDAGNYQLVVSNRYGTALSAPVRLFVAAPVRLFISQTTSNQVELSWAGKGVVIKANSLDCSVWTRLSDTSPLILPIGATPGFFRVVTLASAPELQNVFWTGLDACLNYNDVKACEDCVAAYLISAPVTQLAPSPAAEEAASVGISLGSCISAAQLNILLYIRFLWYGP